MKDSYFVQNFKSITNIKTITYYLYNKIIELGYDVFIHTSRKSKSRYLEIFITTEERIYVRISDHPPNIFTDDRCNFDVYNLKPREGAITFLEFLDKFNILYKK